MAEKIISSTNTSSGDGETFPGLGELTLGLDSSLYGSNVEEERNVVGENNFLGDMTGVLNDGYLSDTFDPASASAVTDDIDGNAVREDVVDGNAVQESIDDGNARTNSVVDGRNVVRDVVSDVVREVAETAAADSGGDGVVPVATARNEVAVDEGATGGNEVLKKKRKKTSYTADGKKFDTETERKGTTKSDTFYHRSLGLIKKAKELYNTTNCRILCIIKPLTDRGQLREFVSPNFEDPTRITLGRNREQDNAPPQDVLPLPQDVLPPAPALQQLPVLLRAPAPQQLPLLQRAPAPQLVLPPPRHPVPSTAADRSVDFRINDTTQPYGTVVPDMASTPKEVKTPVKKRARRSGACNIPDSPPQEEDSGKCAVCHSSDDGSDAELVMWVKCGFRGCKWWVHPTCVHLLYAPTEQADLDKWSKKHFRCPTHLARERIHPATQKKGRLAKICRQVKNK